ncbi:2376_t:CDS:10, partial [Entrophospora sp. SA101]
QNDKALIHVYSLFKEQIHNKLFCPEKLVSLSVSNKGTYCAGGTDNGKIYIWELSTGTLCKVFDAHYKKINVMRFTNDDIALITGSDDSSVNVWLFGSILDTDDDDNNNNDLLIPYYSWSDHSLPITDIICGVGNFNTCRILTSSMDNTCKIWDLSTGYLLTTFIFPSIINCIEFDKIERMFFCGCNNKLIYQVNLYKNIGNSSNGGGIIRSVGGNKKIEDIDTSKSLIFSGHNSQITSIEMPLFNDNILISGSEDGEIIVWDIFKKKNSLITGYLIAYNVLSTISWSYVLYLALYQLYVNQGDYTKTYDGIERILAFVQTAAVLEVRSHWAFTSMTIAWSIAEIIRYLYYAFNLIGKQPDLLLWCRYTFFYLLYPVGAGSEAVLIFKSIPYSIHRANNAFYWLQVAILCVYLPERNI